MSQLFVDNIKNRTGGAIGAPSGAVVTGIVTATSFSGSGASLTGIDATALKDSGGSVKVQANTSGIVVTGVSTFGGNITGTTGSFTGNVSVGGTLTYEDVTNIDSVGVVTARTGIKVLAGGINAVGLVTGTAFTGYDYLRAPFSTTVNFAVTVAAKTSAHRYNGTGSSNAFLIDGVQSPFLTLTPGRTYRFTHDNTGSHPLKFYLEADKTTLYSTGVTFDNAYTEIVVSDSTPQVLHYQCTNHAYMGNAVNTNSNVAATQGGGGISTTKYSPAANAVINIGLSTAQHHDLTLTAGITTITCSGGSFGDSHSLVLTQPSSGIATVGFSTFFLFPSGATPSMSEGSSKVDLVSFVVKRVGAGGTQLLASAGLNYN